MGRRYRHIPVIPTAPGVSMAALQPRERLGALLVVLTPNHNVFPRAVSHDQAQGGANHLTAFRLIGQSLQLVDEVFLLEQDQGFHVVAVGDSVLIDLNCWLLDKTLV